MKNITSIFVITMLLLGLSACGQNTNKNEALIKAITSTENILNKGFTKSQICNLYSLKELKDIDPELSKDKSSLPIQNTYISTISENIDTLIPDISNDVDNFEESLSEYLEQTNQNINKQRLKNLLEKTSRSSENVYTEFETFSGNSSYESICSNLTITMYLTYDIYSNLLIAYKVETGKEWDPVGFGIEDIESSSESDSNNSNEFELEEVGFDEVNQDFSTVIIDKTKK